MMSPETTCFLAKAYRYCGILRGQGNHYMDWEVWLRPGWASSRP